MCEIDWNLFIQLLTAIGTIAVAVIAIWGDWIKIKLTPPKLKIIASKLSTSQSTKTLNTLRLPKLINYNLYMCWS
jgi:hypothetical protein